MNRIQLLESLYKVDNKTKDFQVICKQGGCIKRKIPVTSYEKLLSVYEHYKSKQAQFHFDSVEVRVLV